MYKVDTTTGCWIWQGATCSSGRYGRIEGQPLKMAHREAYIAAKGPIPDGMCVMHSCDRGLCVNPDHLSLGTHGDNMRDAARKGRLPHLKNQSGIKNSNAKYTKDVAEEIRAFYTEHKPSFSALAERFGLKSKGHAHAIVTGRIWK